jgi:HEPN domain-containing protein
MRSREQVIREFVQQWLKKAEVDLRTAKVLLDTDADDYFPCTFHCQQSIEKFLKAYLVQHQIEFRKTHDIDEILDITDTFDETLRTEIGSCTWLTPYGVEFRYPGEYHEVDFETAEEAFLAALLVKKSIIKRLDNSLFSFNSDNETK